MEKVKDQVKTLAEERTTLEDRLHAHRVNLQAYLDFPPPASRNGSQGPYADESAIVELLQGLSQWQKLTVLGLINDRRVALAPAGRLMHRTGTMGGKLKHINSRLYNEVGNHTDIFRWAAPGEFEILPGAERHLSQSTLILVAQANSKSTNGVVEEPEGHEATTGARLFAVGEPTIT